MSRRLVLLAAVIGATVGYGASRLAPSSANPGATVRFSISKKVIPLAEASAVDGTVQVLISLECQWRPGRTSITVKQAASAGCGTLVPGVSYGLMASPIGGARFPKQNGDLGEDLRFVHLRTHGVIDVGPSLMQFGDYSGGARPSIVDDGKTMWIFDYVTERGPEVIRISDSSGAILQRTSMVGISRPLIGINRDGFWMGQAENSLYDSQTTPLGIWWAPIGASQGVELVKTQDDILGFRPTGDSMQVIGVNHPAYVPPTYTAWTFNPTS